MSYGNKPRLCYKYICEECGEATRFNRRERTRAAGMRCSSCGSRRLNPSPHSKANDAIGDLHDKKREYDERMKYKLNRK